MTNLENWVFNNLLLLFLFFGFCKSRDTITPTQPIKDGDLLVSKDETFALGFFSPGNGTSSRRYVGIWYYKISEQTVVWVANRDKPINGTSGAMSIDQHGNLVIYADNSQHVTLWHTNVSAPVMATSNSYSARLLDSGNLMLLFQSSDTKNESFVAWQSFDHPTNTLLPNMKLGLDRRTGLDRFLTSWKSKDDPGTGEYSYRMVPSGWPQLVLFKGSVKLYRILPWSSSKASEKFPIGMLKSSYIDDPEEVSVAYVQVNGSSLSRFFWDELVGGLKMDTWVDVEGQGKGKWVEFYSIPNERCDNYGLCGAYSYCDDSKFPTDFECTCLPGYEPKSANQWNLRDASGGCVEKKRAGLGMCRNREGFVKVEGAQIPDTSWARVALQLRMNECEAVCLMNCSCTAYSSVADSGNCITWYGDLMDVKKFDDVLLEWYIRVDADELDSAFLHSQYGHPNVGILRAALRVRERSWAKLLDFEPTYTYSGRRKARVTDFLLEDPPEPNPSLPEIVLVPLTAEQEMAKKNKMRAMLTATTRAEVPSTQPAAETIIALPSQQPSSSRRAKRARTTETEQRLVDEVDPILPPSPELIPQPESSHRAAPTNKWAPPFVFNNRDIDEDDSVVADKDHLLAFNLARGVCLPKDMEHHSKQLNTELKALRSSTKSMILAIQKNTIAHRQIMELRKTTRHAIRDAEARAAELALSKQKAAELEAEVARLTGLVTSAESDKQRAVTEVKDQYLWEMAALENKKNAEIKELEQKAKDASKEGFKEAEAGYSLQCEAAKELFFKCGWRGAVEKVGCGPETEVYNAPEHFIPASLQEYADELQKQFLGSSDDEDDDDDDDDDGETTETPAIQEQAGDPLARLEPTAENTLPERPIEAANTGVHANLGTDLDAEIDELFV